RRRHWDRTPAWAARSRRCPAPLRPKSPADRAASARRRRDSGSRGHPWRCSLSWRPHPEERPHAVQEEAGHIARCLAPLWARAGRLQVAPSAKRRYAAKCWRARRRCALIRIKVGVSCSAPSQVLAVIPDPLFYLLAIPAIVALGLGKGGFAGVGMISTPLLALTMPPLQAAAILLPIVLC